MIARLRGPAGVAVLALALAWTAGGQWALGRIDPALLVPLLPLPSLLFVWPPRGEAYARRRSSAAGAIALIVAGQALLALALAGWLPWRQLLLAAAAAALAMWLAAMLLVRTRRTPRILLALLFVSAWFGAGHALLATLYRPAAAAEEAADATMLSGLPLRWVGGGDLAATLAEGARDDPALQALEALGPVALVDSLTDSVPPAGGALLLAHPRALAPQDLVAADTFVRGGGHAVILADALSGWPAAYPLGDPRNPPVTSLLTPLLDHWGVEMTAAPAGERAARAVDVGRARLKLFSAGRFERLPGTCRAFAARRVAHCRIGAGEAWLVGDADLLFAPLWRPPLPWAAHLRRADTIEWLADRLWPGAGRGVLAPVWIRDRAR